MTDLICQAIKKAHRSGLKWMVLRMLKPTQDIFFSNMRIPFDCQGGDLIGVQMNGNHVSYFWFGPPSISLGKSWGLIFGLFFVCSLPFVGIFNHAQRDWTTKILMAQSATVAVIDQVLKTVPCFLLGHSIRFSSLFPVMLQTPLSIPFFICHNTPPYSIVKEPSITRNHYTRTNRICQEKSF